MRKISVLGIVLIAFVVSSAFLLKPKAQETEARNVRIEDYPNFFQNKEPIKIIGLFLGADSIESGKDFHYGKDWIRDLRIQIKNVSDQPIKEVILNLDFRVGFDPDNNIQRTERVEIAYGRSYWYSPALYVNRKVPEILIQPGETAMMSYEFNFSGDPDLLAKNLPLIYRKELPNSGYIYASRVVFGDTNKAWYMRHYVMRDDQNQWVSDPSKSYMDGQRTSRIQIKKNKGNSFLPNAAAPASCWDSGTPLVTQEICSPTVQGCPSPNDCNGCMYFRPNLVRMVGGGYHLQSINKQCYHTIVTNGVCGIVPESTCIGNGGNNCLQIFVMELLPTSPC